MASGLMVSFKQVRPPRFTAGTNCSSDQAERPTKTRCALYGRLLLWRSNALAPLHLCLSCWPAQLPVQVFPAHGLG